MRYKIDGVEVSTHRYTPTRSGLFGPERTGADCWSVERAGYCIGTLVTRPTRAAVADIARKHDATRARLAAHEAAHIVANGVIVSRHQATIEWLRQQVPALADVPVLESATAVDVRGRIVYGNVPLHLAAVAERVVAVEFTGTPPRGAEYGAAEMEAAGVRLRTYTVEAVD